MAVTTTYSWSTVAGPVFANSSTGGPQNSAAITAVDSSFFTAWNDTSPPNAVEGRIFDSTLAASTGEFLVNSTTLNAQFDPATTTLPNGNVVVSYTDFSADPLGDVRDRIFTPSGVAVGNDFTIATGSLANIHSDVAGLTNGRFVTVFTTQFGGGDNDIDFTISNADGTPFLSFNGVDTDSTLNTDNASVAGLAGGGYVVAFEQSPKAGGSTSTYFRLYTANGSAVAAKQQIDNIGTINSDIQVAALQDGGFAVAYTDNGYGTGTDITVKLFNADGSSRTGYMRANTTTAGDQNKPTLTTLANGYVSVAWSDSSSLVQQTYTPNGVAVAGNYTIAGSVVEGEIAGLANGMLADVRDSTVTDAGGDNSIRVQVDQLTRTSIGDGSNDTIVGDALRDVMSGGAGDDTYVVDSASDVVTETAGNGTDAVLSRGSYSLAAGQEIEKLYAADPTSTTALNLTGNEFANILQGNDGTNTLDGGTGADTMIGRGGDDTYIVDNAGDTVIEANGGGTDAVLSRISYTLGAGQSVEKLYAADPASTTALNFTGNDIANIVQGNAGANVIDGGAGADTMIGLGGDDTFVVDNPGDVVIEAAGGGTDAVLTRISYTLAAGQEIEKLVAADPTLTTALNLTGNTLANTLVGNAGNNVIDGGTGADAMAGRGGDDTYIVDNAGDSVVEFAGGGTDAVLSRVSYTLTAGQEIEKLYAADPAATTALNLTGNETGNILQGNDGVNVLDGFGGHDILIGKGGDDVFTFHTAPGPDNLTHIMDFAPSSPSSHNDTLLLDHSVFTALPVGTLSPDAFKDIISGVEDGSDRILYDHTNGALFYDADGAGGADAKLFGVLDNHAAISSIDFKIG